MRQGLMITAAALALSACAGRLEFEGAPPGTRISVGDKTCTAPCSLEAPAGNSLRVAIAVPPPPEPPAVIEVRKPAPAKRKPKPKVAWPSPTVAPEIAKERIKENQPPAANDPEVWPKAPEKRP